MKFICSVLLLIGATVAQAHEPNLSSLMIYEQHDKYLILIKSSLNAFEGEVDYHFSKNAYKTPGEFKQLVIKHFEKNCFVIINNDTVKLINPYVIPGHETTLFAELQFKPHKIRSLYVRNTLFKEMHNNICEVIITLKDLPQKQVILTNSNENEVMLTIENNGWTLKKTVNTGSKTSGLFLNGFILFILLSVLAIVIFRKKNSRQAT